MILILQLYRTIIILTYFIFYLNSKFSFFTHDPYEDKLYNSYMVYRDLMKTTKIS